MRTSKKHVRVLSCGLAALLFSAPAFSQSAQGEEPQTAETTAPDDVPADSPAADPSDADAARLGKVTVTGSHIRRAQIEGPQPIQVVTPDMVREVGGVKLGDFLPYVTANQGQVIFPDNKWGAPAGYFFNLRGLGPEATLVLVNGRRVAGYGGDGALQFNVDSIPLAAIERVEILKDGASAIYGADAIAGVVNIILKDDYSGFEINGGYSDTADGGAAESSLEFVGGTFFGRTNLTLAASWYNQDPLYYREREITATVDQRWRGGYDRRSIWSSPPNALLLEDYANGVFTFAPDPACPAEDLTYIDWAGSELCLYNFASTALLMAGNERWGAELSASHPLTANMTLTAQLGYNDDHIKRELAAAPVPGFAPADHPDNPFGQDVRVFSRIADGALRTNFDDTIERRGNLGLEGFSGAWAWRGHATWSDSSTTNTYYGLVTGERYAAALRGEGGPDGDQWYNPFGVDPDNDPALVQWMTEVGESWLRARERTVGVVADAPVLDLPAGELGIAVGAEYRDEAFWSTANEAGGAGWTPVNGKRQIRSAFVEASVPVVEGLEAQLAARYEDYSDFGSHWSPKVALAWRPDDSVLLRASYAESFRAPEFGELYTPAESGEYTFPIEDPERCPVTGLVTDCNGFFLYTGAGNPDLDPETGESWNIGIVWSPGNAPGLDLEVDLWRFVFDDWIAWIGGDWVVENYPRWVNRADPTPEDVALGIPGPIEEVRQGPINIAKWETGGVDFAIRYALGFDTVGDFTAEISGTYVDYYRLSDNPTWEHNGKNLAGTDIWESVPRWRVVSSLRWLRGPNAATAMLRFVSSYMEETPWPNEDGTESDRSHRVGSWTTLDLQYTRTFRGLGEARLSVGCTNCADRDPPLYLSDEFDRGLHNVFGRGWYVRWAQPFGGGGD